MPATSKAQFRLMKGIAEGTIAPKGGLTKEKAAEYVSGQSPKGLPEKVKQRALHRYVSKIEKATKEKRWRIH
jgi:hypothetical protein